MVILSEHVSDLISFMALGISLFGLLVPWWQAGHARLEVRFERWVDERDDLRRHRMVVVNRGEGTATAVGLGVPIDDKDANETTIDLDIIYPGQELYLELAGTSTFHALTSGLLRWTDGRIPRPRSREFLVTIKDLV